MAILSLSSPSFPSFAFFPATSPSPSPSHRHFLVPLRPRSASARSLASCYCSLCSFKVRAKERALMDRGSPQNLAASFSSSRTFLDARTEQELLSGIRKEAEGGSLPSNVAAAMEELYQNYKNAVFQSGDPRADETILSNMAVLLDRIYMDVVDPFVFTPHHKAKREPFDYYMFGQNYIRPLIDFRNSYIGNISLFHEMEEKLKQGHNIIVISNHQTEADPAIIALLLEKSFPDIAENMTYVAGDRVITDPLCKPFSMGRNLICVYSKKHMNDVPELVEMKRQANTRSLKEMAMLLRNIYKFFWKWLGKLSPPSGSRIIWIAPSGGRDRPNSHTGEWMPEPFDTSSVDNIRRLAQHSSPPGHIYPMALLCYDIMPPPPQVEKEIGEKRVISFHGVGLSVAPEISFAETTAACESPETAKEAYTQALFNSVTEQYIVLKSAIHGQQGLEASTPNVSLSQP